MYYNYYYYYYYYLFAYCNWAEPGGSGYIHAHKHKLGI